MVVVVVVGRGVARISKKESVGVGELRRAVECTLVSAALCSSLLAIRLLPGSACGGGRGANGGRHSVDLRCIGTEGGVRCAGAGGSVGVDCPGRSLHFIVAVISLHFLGRIVRGGVVAGDLCGHGDGAARALSQQRLALAHARVDEPMLHLIVGETRRLAQLLFFKRARVRV